MLSARDVIDAPHFSTKHWPSFCDVTLTFKKAIRSDNGQWLKLDECTYKLLCALGQKVSYVNAAVVRGVQGVPCIVVAD